MAMTDYDFVVDGWRCCCKKAWKELCSCRRFVITIQDRPCARAFSLIEFAGYTTRPDRFLVLLES